MYELCCTLDIISSGLGGYARQSKSTYKCVDDDSHANVNKTFGVINSKGIRQLAFPYMRVKWFFIRHLHLRASYICGEEVLLLFVARPNIKKSHIAVGDGVQTRAIVYFYKLNTWLFFLHFCQVTFKTFININIICIMFFNLRLFYLASFAARRFIQTEFLFWI